MLGQLKEATVPEVDITGELALRVSTAPDYLKEKLALQDLALQMADQPSAVLPRLVELAMSICESSSAGISLNEETGIFRWHFLHGELARFEGATTPRDHSPCGVTLDRNEPILMRNPERVYSWISDAGIVVPEVLLVPLYIRGENPLGTLWVVAREHKNFNDSHARVLTELATFAGIALRMRAHEDQLNKALAEQETLTREMNHRIKNLFAITDAIIRLTSRSSSSKDELVENVRGRLHALAAANALVRKSFAEGSKSNSSSLQDVLKAILKPHRNDNIEIDGEDVQLGERSTNSVALIFHELATNAAKYGALSDGGTLRVFWTVADFLMIDWVELPKSPIAQPEKAGFGTELVKNTVQSLGGEINYSWKPNTLRIGIMIPVKALTN